MYWYRLQIKWDYKQKTIIRSELLRLEVSGQLKNPMALWGIEPATFRLVAQCPILFKYDYLWFC
jgi:hypothetical protein